MWQVVALVLEQMEQTDQLLQVLVVSELHPA
jgi:hypothetical protein